jgi:hypothetical protein
MSNEPELMVVYVTDNLPDAHIVSGRLENSDIQSVIVHEPAGTALGITIGTLGEVRVLVRAEDYDRAQQLLEEDESPLLTEDVDQIIFDDSADADQ